MRSALCACSTAAGQGLCSSGACPAEFYDGKADKVRCFNDFYVYSPKKDRWTQVISPGGCALPCTEGSKGAFATAGLKIATYAHLQSLRSHSFAWADNVRFRMHVAFRTHAYARISWYASAMPPATQPYPLLAAGPRRAAHTRPWRTAGTCTSLAASSCRPTRHAPRKPCGAVKTEHACSAGSGSIASATREPCRACRSRIGVLKKSGCVQRFSCAAM